MSILTKPLVKIEIAKVPCLWFFYVRRGDLDAKFISNSNNFDQGELFLVFFLVLNFLFYFYFLHYTYYKEYN